LSQLNTFLQNYEQQPIFLLFLGLVSSFLFSVTFLVNRLISLDGGHWFFSGSLRVIYAIILFSLGFILFKGFSYFKLVLKEYLEHFIFWTIAGTIGFGFFYSLLCFAAEFSPAWIVATTWQITIISSLFVLTFFGKKLSKKIWLFTVLIFLGVMLVNLSHFQEDNLDSLFIGFISLLIASFCYPFGNQMVWEEKQKRKKHHQDVGVINNSFVKVFLLILGSVPFWIMLYFFTDATPPNQSQYISVAIITIVSGILATSLFLYVRSKADTSNKVMLVDSTQSSQVFFSLIAEMAFLGAAFPNAIGLIGILVTMIGLGAITKIK